MLLVIGASQMAKEIRRTIAVPRWVVIGLGVVLVVAGMILPVWSIGTRTQQASASYKIPGGPLRPAMVILPEMPDGSSIAVADSEISQAQFHRVMRLIPGRIARIHDNDWTQCPAPLYHKAGMPITCVTPQDAERYAYWLTRIENIARETNNRSLLSQCYELRGIELYRNGDPNCTGYRLPTKKEWQFAARALTHVKYAAMEETELEKLCRYAHLPDCASTDPGPRSIAMSAPNAWFLHDMSGNVAEITVKVTSETGYAVVGGSWRKKMTIRESIAISEITSIAGIGFRIVRSAI